MMKTENTEKLTFRKVIFIENEYNMSPGKYYCVFFDGKREKLISYTKTLKQADLHNGETYIIGFDSSLNPNYVKGKQIEIIRKGSHIIKHDLKTGKYFNLTVNVEVDENFKPLKGEKLSNAESKHSHTALMAFAKGKVTESYLLNKNKQGVYFLIKYSINRKDERFGFNNIPKNEIIIEKETQGEIDKMKKYVIGNFLFRDIEKHFMFTTKIVKPEKKIIKK